MMRMLDSRFSQGGLALGALILVGLSWHYGYQRAVRSYRHDHDRVAALRQNLSRLETMIASEGGKEPWLIHNQQHMAMLKAHFPQQAQLPQVLNALIDALKMSDLHIINITQGKLELVRGSAGSVLVDGAPCYQFPLTVTLEGRYYVILTALGRLVDESFPALVSIEQADLRLKDSSGAVLSATLTLHLHFVGNAPTTSPTASRVFHGVPVQG